MNKDVTGVVVNFSNFLIDTWIKRYTSIPHAMAISSSGHSLLAMYGVIGSNTPGTGKSSGRLINDIAVRPSVRLKTCVRFNIRMRTSRAVAIGALRVSMTVIGLFSTLPKSDSKKLTRTPVCMFAWPCVGVETVRDVERQAGQAHTYIYIYNILYLLHGLAVNMARYCTSVQSIVLSRRRGIILHMSAMSRHIDR